MRSMKEKLQQLLESEAKMNRTVNGRKEKIMKFAVTAMVDNRNYLVDEDIEAVSKKRVERFFELIDYCGKSGCSIQNLEVHESESWRDPELNGNGYLWHCVNATKVSYEKLVEIIAANSCRLRKIDEAAEKVETLREQMAAAEAELEALLEKERAAGRYDIWDMHHQRRG